MNVVEVKPSLCTGCAACVAHCPLNLMTIGADAKATCRTDGPTCMECGHCVAICPEAAIEIAGLPAGAFDAARLPDSRQLQELFASRRSIRVFESRPVSRPAISALIESCRWAPTGKNSLPVEWTVVEDAGRIRDLGSRMLAAARRDPAMAKRYAHVRPGEDPIFRGAPHLILAHGAKARILTPADGVTAAAYLELAAHAAGLGTCWSGLAMASSEGMAALRQLAGIPDDHVVMAVLMFGHPADRYRRIPGRPIPAIHWN